MSINVFLTHLKATFVVLVVDFAVGVIVKVVVLLILQFWSINIHLGLLKVNVESVWWVRWFKKSFSCKPNFS